MKLKIILAMLAVALIAAGCGSSAKQEPTQNETAKQESVDQPVAETPTASAENTLSKPVAKPAVKPSSPSPQPPAAPSKQPGVYTLSEVQSANSESKCWTTVGDNVYDISSFINKHPGGRAKVLALCGKDGTAPFTKQHGSFQQAIDTLASLKIGVLAK